MNSSSMAALASLAGLSLGLGNTRQVHPLVRLRAGEELKEKMDKAVKNMRRTVTNSPKGIELPPAVKAESMSYVRSNVDYPRNKPCYCGSKKKFKVCCLNKKQTVEVKGQKEQTPAS